MEESSGEMLVSWLANSGATIPQGVSTIEDLTPSTLVSICSQSLRLIDNTLSFPTSLPHSMADQFKICTDLSVAVQRLGYIGDMSFHKFLYPSEEDIYKLVRFLVERLSESSEAGKFTEMKEVEARALVEKDDLRSISKDSTEKIGDRLLHQCNDEVISSSKDPRLKTEVIGASIAKPDDFVVIESNVFDSASQNIKEVSDSRNNASENKEAIAHKHVSEHEQKLTSRQEHSSEMRYKIEKLQSQEKVLLEEVSAKSSELLLLEEEHEMLSTAIEMAFDDQHPIDFYILQLNEQIDAEKHDLVELESQWDAVRKPLEEKKRSLEEAVYATKPGAQEKLQKLKEIDLETESIISETKRREEEVSKLKTDFDKQPKLASRGSYIQQIKEITKNIRKQDADIERILKETRELQLESNSIQERLHRTYAVVDETVFREAKKDPVGRQAYRLLTIIHESFQQISEKIIATDRTSREVADLEAKLASMASRSLNIDKLQADLDAIQKENEFLQQSCFNTSATV